jgi:methyl-accepting chemotaxis protein
MSEMMKSMKLGTRMATVFVVLGVMVAGIAGLGGWQIDALRAQSAEITELMGVRVLLAQWQAQTGANAARTVAALLSADEKLGERLAPAMKEVTGKISEMQKRIEAMPLSDAERKSFAAIADARKTYIAAREETLRLKKAGDASASIQFETKFTPGLKGYEAAMAAFIDEYSRNRLEAQAAAQAASARMITIVGGICGAFVVVAALLAYALTRSITRPLKRAVQIADRVAEGDLTSDIEVNSTDELGQLAAALKRMNANLRNIVTDVRSGTEVISHASGEIAAGNADLSHRTEEQASSLEETASSMEELTSTVKHNADNARQASRLAATASEVAVKGGHVVADVVQRMSAINDSSKKIADIIGVIDGIAFQTNILALNAAVEAARAGEQGRGFAVVATEVRTLAQRSAGAAKEIKQLISDSVRKVEDGTRLVGEAGKTMDEVVASVHRVTEIVAEISAATGEQSSGIEQVNQAVMQMDNVTQQNAALVEEAAAAAESMQQQAQALAHAVASFKLERTASVDAEAPAAQTGTRRAGWVEPATGPEMRAAA